MMIDVRICPLCSELDLRIPKKTKNRLCLDTDSSSHLESEASASQKHLDLVMFSISVYPWQNDDCLTENAYLYRADWLQKQITVAISVDLLH